MERAFAQERAKKKREEEEAAALREQLAAFESDFGDAPKTETKAFVRMDIVNANKSVAASDGVKPSVYKPTSSVFAQLAKKTLPTTTNSFEENRKLAAEKARRMLQEAHGGKGPAPEVVAPTISRPPASLRPPRPGQKKEQKKAPSNLEMFKEELKRAQEERDKRKDLRDHLTQIGVDADAVDRIAPSLNTPYMMGGGSGGGGGGGSAGGLDTDTDPVTTNLYVCNLPPNVDMQDLFDTFGTYGPLASAKILYPREGDNRRTDHLCGFVAFMSRTDADRALANLGTGLVIGDDPIKMSFAKPVSIPMQPFYIPPALQALSLPDPPTGLPFNAKPRQMEVTEFLKKYGKLPNPTELPTDDEKQMNAYKQMMKNAVVRVVIPTDSQLLALIHRTVEFVVREGVLFEMALMKREHGNPMFRFLYDNYHPAHVYYRWRLYSLLQGDLPNEWRTCRFRMFDEGSWWEPPIQLGEVFRAMPSSLYHTAYTIPKPDKRRADDRRDEKSRKRRHSENASDDEEKDKRKARALSSRKRDELEGMLRSLTPEKASIGDAMVWCCEHASCAKEIADCIYESLTIDETPIHKKIARLYLVADILANCALRGVRDVFYYRQYFQELFVKIFVAVGRTLRLIESRIRAEQFKQRVMNCFRAWEDAAVYPNDALIHAQNVFLGLVEPAREQSSANSSDSEDVDGDPIDIDGEPLGAVGEGGEKGGDGIYDDDDLDGVPLEQTMPAPVAVAETKAPAFKTSQWKTVDAEEAKKSVGPKSKWEDDDGGGGGKWSSGGAAESDSKTSLFSSNQMSDSDGEIEDKEDLLGAQLAQRALDDQRRKLMREIEVKVMALQDDMEGEPDCKQQVDKLRADLMREMESKLAKGGVGGGGEEKEKKEKKKKDKKDKKDKKEDKEKDRKRSRSRSRDRERERDRKRSRERERDRRSRSRERRRSRSRSRDRKRSRSRDRSRRSRSPDRRRERSRSRGRR